MIVHFTSNSLSQTRLTSAESIAEQTGILISQVCPQAAEPAACEAVRALSISPYISNIFIFFMFISHLNMISRLSFNGGETWPTAFILLSSELATPVSALAFAR